MEFGYNPIIVRTGTNTFTAKPEPTSLILDWLAQRPNR
jgi:hypothetical protein